MSALKTLKKTLVLGFSLAAIATPAFARSDCNYGRDNFCRTLTDLNPTECVASYKISSRNYSVTYDFNNEVFVSEGSEGGGPIPFHRMSEKAKKRIEKIRATLPDFCK